MGSGSECRSTVRNDINYSVVSAFSRHYKACSRHFNAQIDSAVATAVIHRTKRANKKAATFRAAMIGGLDNDGTLCPTLSARFLYFLRRGAQFVVVFTLPLCVLK